MRLSPCQIISSITLGHHVNFIKDIATDSGQLLRPFASFIYHGFTASICINSSLSQSSDPVSGYQLLLFLVDPVKSIV